MKEQASHSRALAAVHLLASSTVAKFGATHSLSWSHGAAHRHPLPLGDEQLHLVDDAVPVA